MKIAVVGYSCTGKTTVTTRLSSLYPDHKVYHTDDYASNYHDAHLAVMREIHGKDNYIVDGVHAFEILRKGAQSRSIFFDVIIHCKADNETRMDRYKKRNPEQAHRQPAIEKSLDTIFNSYLAICGALGIVPNIIEFKT